MNNIKDILNETDTSAISPKLPEGHRTEFLTKLENSAKIPVEKTSFSYWKYVAAACVLLVGLGTITITNLSSQQTNEAPLFTEMKSIEDEYLQHIASEWETFETTANDANLVQKYRERLDNLDASYQKLKQEFLIQKNSLTTLDKMIKNLQMRLTLLQEIQQHLKRLQDAQQNI